MSAVVGQNLRNSSIGLIGGGLGVTNFATHTPKQSADLKVGHREEFGLGTEETQDKTVQVRQATFKDAPELACLRWECSGGQAAGETLEQFQDQFARFLNEAFCRNNWNVWVAEQDGKMIGHLFVHQVLRVPRPGQTHDRWGEVTEFLVTPGAPKQDIETEMLCAVTEWAREQGLEALRVWPGDESVAFYERLGFARIGQALELGL